MAETFANLVAKVSADNRDLETGMKRSEQIVQASASKMTASLNTVGTAGVDKTAKSFAALGAAGSLAGSQFGGVASQIGGVAAALASLGIAMSPVVIALGVLAAVGVGVWKLMKDDIEDVIPSFDAINQKTQDLAVNLAELTDQFSKAEAANSRLLLQAGRLGVDAEGNFDQAAFNAAHTALTKRQAVEDAIADSKARQLAADKESAALEAVRKTNAAELAGIEKSRAATTQNLRDQLAIARGQDPLTLGNMPMVDRLLRLETRITNEKTAQAALDKAAATSAETRVKALGQQLAIASGLRTAASFEQDPRAREIMEALAAIRGGVTTTAGTPAGFSIGSRSSSEFRFGGPRAGGEAIGQQSEQEKQTKELAKIAVSTEKTAELLSRAAPGTLESSSGGLGFGSGF